MQNEQVEQLSVLAAQLHSENEHLRKQVDHLTQVVAMQTQQQGELVKCLESPARSSVAAWLQVKLQG